MTSDYQRGSDVHFSIITVCRNECSKIRLTCESVLSQTYKGYEWIVIDGASTDGTLEILEEYKDRIDCLISEDDTGVYNAMNKGISKALGQYLIFMNGGDRFSDAGVMATVASAPQKGIIYGDIAFAGVASEVRQFPDVLREGYLLRNMMPHQASFIQRQLFEQYGSYDESYKVAGDYDLFVRFIEVHRVSSTHIARVLALFEDGGISSHPQHRALRKRENHRVRCLYFPCYRYSWKRLRQSIRNGFDCLYRLCHQSS